MRRAWAGATAAVIAAMAGGCASQRHVAESPADKSAAAPSAKAPAPGLDELHRAARDQEKHPVAEAKALPPPPGMTPELIKALRRSASERAAMPLSRAIEAVSGTDPGDAPAPPPIDEDAEREATRLYVSGKQKILEGKPGEATIDFREALKRTPGAGEVWRELAEAQLSLGANNEAAESLRKAEAAGVRDARVLELLGRFEADRGDPGAAARWFARAYSSRPQEADPLLMPVIEYELARALSVLGYDAAARDALLRLLDRSPAFTASSRYMADYGAIFRRQGDLWRDTGDLEMRLGHHGAALAAYEKAAELPTVEGQSPMVRLVYAAMKTGRPAAAAAALVGRIADADGRIGDEDMDLLRYVTQVGSARTMVTASLGRLQDTLGAKSLTLEASLARARAAVAPPAEARRLLTAHLTLHPRDAQTAEALMNAAANPAEAAEAAAACARQQPLATGSLAEGLLRSHHDPVAALEALTARRTEPGAALTAAWMNFKRGAVAAAADLAATVPISGGSASAAALTRAELALNAGRPAEAAAALAALDKTQSPQAARSRALILAMLQRNAEALAVLAPMLDGPGTSPDERLEDLLISAKLAASLGRVNDAERWLRTAATIDAADDRALGLLLELYAQGGAKADAAKQAQVVRELRQSHAEGRVLRIARAREYARRSLFAQAEREAEGIAADSPDDRAAIEVLTAVWGARGRSDAPAAVRHGLGWLDARVERRPLDPMLAAARVTLLASTDRAEEAEVYLRQLLDKGAGPDVSRLLERLLRDNLKHAPEADTLALKRLEGRPRTVGEGMELSEIYARTGRAADAASAVREAAGPGVTLMPDQRARLLIATGGVAERALRARIQKQPDVETERAAVAMLDLAAARGASLTPALHELRVRLLPTTGAATDDILAACDAATAQSPDLKSKPVVWALATLVTMGEGAKARDLISHAVARSGGDTVELYGAWCEVVGLTGSASDVRELISSCEKAGKLREIADRMRGREAGDVKDYRAEVAYLMGDSFTRNGRIDEANGAYELALEFQPDHGWACNNLGYYLADRGGDLARAGVLLEKAAAALPDEAPVLDSLGWLRYKQGRLDDTHDPATGELRERGAVTLLERAAKTDRGQSDAVILNHFGDSLWLAGRKTDAQRYWTLSQATATQVLSRAGSRPVDQADAPKEAGQGAQSLPDDPAFAELREIATACARKRSDASSGAPVRVAPQADNPDPQPKPAPPPAKPETPQTTDPHD